jgi:hypothetical protein
VVKRRPGEGRLVLTQGYTVKLFGDVLPSSRLPQPARKGGAHRGNALGDGNNAWIGIIRSQVLRVAYLRTQFTD